MKLYGVIIVNTEGFGNACEGDVIIKNNKKDALESAYEHYKETFEKLAENDEIAYVIEEDSELDSFEDFKSTIAEFYSPQVIQCYDYHIQYEYFEREVE